MSAQNKPNIILIVADDADYKTLHVNGGTSYSTPNLDSMAHAGMNFTQCHSSPLCSPSRVMLLTGKYNFRNYTKWGVLDTSQKTIANLLQDAGYATACFGKWQFDGGDNSIKKFGFDSYAVFNAFEVDENTEFRYKNPTIYTNGAYATTAETSGKYGEDIFTDSVNQFISNHKSNPFFIYYPMALVHEPFQPTPDDTAYASEVQKSDTAYYPSMVKYMDKKVGEILDQLKASGIENNTIIFFSGDNGTSGQIYEDEDSILAQGGKGSTTELGTHVPFIAYGPQFVAGNTTNNNLIDFTDFFPAIAKLANITVPDIFMPLDGIDFTPQLTLNFNSTRTFIFNHFDARPGISRFIRWAQTKEYKLYDSVDRAKQEFYDIIKDPGEKFVLVKNTLTPDEAIIRKQLQDVINGYAIQGFPLFKKPQLLSVADTAASILDSIEINGGSAINASGIVWSRNPGPVLLAYNHTKDRIAAGAFISNVNRLQPNTIYFLKTYATNKAGTGYSDEISFTTLLKSPVALNGIYINSQTFKALWKNSYIPGGIYKIDVSTNSSFSILKKDSLAEGFNNGSTAPAGWIITNGIIANYNHFGKQSPSLEFNLNNKYISTQILNAPATNLSFWIKGLTNDPGSLSIEAFNGLAWDTIDVILPSQKESIKTYTFPQEKNYIQFRFIIAKSSGYVLIDDINIHFIKQMPSFLPGYNNRNVSDTSVLITDLKPDTTYYYRVRVSNAHNISSNSNTVAFKTCNLFLNNMYINNYCANTDSGSVIINVEGGSGFTFNWTGPDGFVSSLKNINNLKAGLYHLNITSAEGCAIDTVAEIKQFNLYASLTTGTMLCNDLTTKITIKLQEGESVSSYSLFNGFKTIGPQTDSNFIVPAGNYQAIVTDNIGCSFTTSFLNIIHQCGDKNFIVTPNPTGSEFNLFLNKNTADKSQVIVLNVLGKKLFETKAVFGDKIVFGKNFAAGMYIVQIINTGSTETIKVIKN